MSFDLGDDFDRVLWIDGVALDRADEILEAAAEEVLPDAALKLLADWERVYGIVPLATATVTSRRAAVKAAKAATGGLNKSYFESLASALGYTIGTVGSKHLRIVDGQHLPFRVAYSQIEIDRIWDQASGADSYTWQVLGSSVESDTVLQGLFERLKPAATTVIFINE
jgi:uncharacterized protein YmfQ (DUF2313 family)